jgi:hypothetical protein
MGGPLPVGFIVMVTFAGAMVPAGNPLPRRVTLLPPVADAGETVINFTVEADCTARAAAPQVLKIVKRTAIDSNALFLMYLATRI